MSKNNQPKPQNTPQRTTISIREGEVRSNNGSRTITTTVIKPPTK